MKANNISSKISSDLSQVKILTDILSINTADMCWCSDLSGNHLIARSYNIVHKELNDLRITMMSDIETQEYPAWSLSQLLLSLPDEISFEDKKDIKGYNVRYFLQCDFPTTLKYIHDLPEYLINDDNVKSTILYTNNNNLVDSCVEMLKQLYDLNKITK